MFVEYICIFDDWTHEYVQDGSDPVTVEGNYNGGSGEKSFYLPHPAKATFDISEEKVADGDERPA